MGDVSPLSAYKKSVSVLHGRITYFRNWCPSLTNGKLTTILCLEFWCFNEDPLWSKSDSELSQLAEKELRSIKILSENDRILKSFSMKISKSYPVYQLGYINHLEKLQAYVDKIQKLLAIGRYGAFKYNNQDHSILMGIRAAQEIARSSFKNHWEMNTGDQYQEAGKIDEKQVIPLAA